MAVSSPLLEASIDGAHGVLLSIAGGSDLGLFEVSAAATLIQGAAHDDANIIFGTVIDDALGDEVRVTVIAAGFEGGQPPRRQPVSRSADVRTPPPRAVPAAEPPPTPVVDPVSAPAPAPVPAMAAPVPASTFARPGPTPSPRTNGHVDDDLDVPDFLK
jgi:cell division protein FtsZ